MRTIFDQQLDALTTIIAGLCAVIGGVVPAGYQAPLPRDMALAEGAADECDKIAHTVVSSKASVADSCHMGDLALSASEIVSRGDDPFVTRGSQRLRRRNGMHRSRSWRHDQNLCVIRQSTPSELHEGALSEPVDVCQCP